MGLSGWRLVAGGLRTFSASAPKGWRRKAWRMGVGCYIRALLRQASRSAFLARFGLLIIE